MGQLYNGTLAGEDPVVKSGGFGCVLSGADPRSSLKNASRNSRLTGEKRYFDG